MAKTLLAMMTVALAMMACSDFNASDNGDLDGLWQLTAVDSLPSGPSADVHELGVFWAIQHHLLEMRSTRGGHVNVFFRFEHNGNTLTLSTPMADNRPVSDSIITDVHVLYFYGLSHLAETLQVLHLTSGHMTLQSERLRMYFRKY